LHAFRPDHHLRDWFRPVRDSPSNNQVQPDIRNIQ
jgi:hypothetical protein